MWFVSQTGYARLTNPSSITVTSKGTTGIYSFAKETPEWVTWQVYQDTEKPNINSSGPSRKFSRAAP